jgi:tRNA(Ile2) C34 agmatinyltransferase TiaS
MTPAALLDAPRRGGVPESGGGECTLDELIAGVWAELLAERAAACPVCGGELAARYGAGSAPVGGRCRACGTELS